MTEKQEQLFESGWNDIHSFIFDHDMAEKGDVCELISSILEIEPESEEIAQCDVEGCKSNVSSGGCAWEETGYWSVCSQHAGESRNGKPQPKMKQSAIDRENSRDKTTGYLPIVKEEK
jgi:hypothetical protein